MGACDACRCTSPIRQDARDIGIVCVRVVWCIDAQRKYNSCKRAFCWLHVGLLLGLMSAVLPVVIPAVPIANTTMRILTVDTFHDDIDRRRSGPNREAFMNQDSIPSTRHERICFVHGQLFGSLKRGCLTCCPKFCVTLD